MKQDHTEIVCIIDQSGSMSSIKMDAIGGYNEFIESQKKLPGTAQVTTVLFSSALNIPTFASNGMKMGYGTTDPRVVRCSGVPIADAVKLNEENYTPNGQTALLDSIGLTIDEVGVRLSKMNEADRPGKVLFCIITDGGENSSREYTSARIKEMIELQRGTYSWEFIYIGANQDSFLVSGSLGMSAAFTTNFVASAAGVRSAYKSMDFMATSYRSN